MDIEKVRELVKLVEESGVAELEVSHGDDTVRIRKDSEVVMAPSPAPLPPPAATVAAAPAPETAAGAPTAVPTGWREVTSPIVGSFYRSSSPDVEPFVEVGSRVAAGETLCIVEAMKVMNEIEAEFAGVVREICVENGAPVEAEAALFLIEPV